MWNHRKNDMAAAFRHSSIGSKTTWTFCRSAWVFKLQTWGFNQQRIDFKTKKRISHGDLTTAKAEVERQQKWDGESYERMGFLYKCIFLVEHAIGYCIHSSSGWTMVKPRRRTMSFLEDDVPNIFRDEVRLLGLIGSLPASIRFFLGPDVSPEKGGAILTEQTRSSGCFFAFSHPTEAETHFRPCVLNIIIIDTTPILATNPIASAIKQVPSLSFKTPTHYRSGSGLAYPPKVIPES